MKAVELFKYLGSIVSNDASANAEITARIAKATSAFGRLTKYTIMDTMDLNGVPWK